MLPIPELFTRVSLGTSSLTTLASHISDAMSLWLSRAKPPYLRKAVTSGQRSCGPDDLQAGEWSLTYGISKDINPGPE